MGRMSEQEMQAFLDEPRVGHMVTLQPDGSPQAAPIWYEYRDGKFLVWTDRFTRRFKNISGDPRVTMSIASDDQPYRYVTVEATVTIRETDIEATAISIATRYKGLESGTAFVEDYQKEGVSVLLILAPSKLVSWKDD
ncbi:MAG: TIGR03618 family F420-dependent PPOX class oxidoreductase [SAR202 cluster bacterium]|jgi:PPOX class probable F420-dependent enzyme|nr:TIGR03618 family F420-dependent PPOX class oxidoreductase [SAR202 cluster bacterium]|tara:strand:+ start:2305 stop:2718 length:414 start_codon:yes stop_codon:yes gene_type:complete